jgi:hypothetical protein
MGGSIVCRRGREGKEGGGGRALTAYRRGGQIFLKGGFVVAGRPGIE